MQLIDAGKLIEFIENRYDITWENNYDGGIKDACVDILNFVEKQPTINQWIPVSERLPDNHSRVLVTIKIPKREPRVRSGYYSDGLFSNDNGDCWRATDPEVTAWCPIPEPWRGEQE